MVTTTGDHVCIMDDDTELPAKELRIRDKLKLVDYPPIDESINTPITVEEAELLGMVVGDGSIDKGKYLRLTNKDTKLKDRFVELCKIVLSADEDNFYSHDTTSGFSDNIIGYVQCNIPYIKDIYSNVTSVFGHKLKRVPCQILNSSVDVMEAFLVGYNNCDGLKKNPCTYKFKNFKTNSETLTAGLLYLISKVTGQRYNVTVEESWRWGKQQFYYSINF